MNFGFNRSSRQERALITMMNFDISVPEFIPKKQITTKNTTKANMKRTINFSGMLVVFIIIQKAFKNFFTRK